MANIKKYTKQNHPDKLSEHFSYKEVCCKCCGNLTVDMNQIEKMEQVRKTLGVPINITSWYRCPTNNKRCGGASSSRHLFGDACDFYCGHTQNALTVLDVLNRIFNGKRFGIYESSAGKNYAFIHCDCSNVNSKLWVSHLVGGKNSYTYYNSYAMLKQALLSDKKINWSKVLI